MRGIRFQGVGSRSFSSSSAHSQQCGLGGMIGGRVRGPWCQIHVVGGRAGLELYLLALYLHMLCFVVLFFVTLYSVVQERVSI